MNVPISCTFACATISPSSRKHHAVKQVFEYIKPCMQAPQVLRLAFHDAGTWEEASGTGGPNGSIQFEGGLSINSQTGIRRGFNAAQQVRFHSTSNTGATPKNVCCAKRAPIVGQT
jgi:Peroxidase